MLWLFSFLHVNTSAWCYYYCVRFIIFFVVSLCILCYAALLSFNFAFFSLQSHVTLAIIMHYFTYSSNVYATQNHVKLGVCMRLIEYFEMVWDGRYSLRFDFCGILFSSISRDGKKSTIRHLTEGIKNTNRSKEQKIKGEQKRTHKIKREKIAMTKENDIAACICAVLMVPVWWQCSSVSAIWYENERRIQRTYADWIGSFFFNIFQL